MGSLAGCTPASGLAVPSGARQGRVLTVVAAPVDVDAAPVVAGELRQGEAGRVGCGGGRGTVSTGDSSCPPPTAPWSAPVPPVLPVPAHHMRRTRRSGPRSHRPGHTSRRWGCSGRWRRRTGWGSRSGLARRDRWSVSGPCFARGRWGTTPRAPARPRCEAEMQAHARPQTSGCSQGGCKPT